MTTTVRPREPRVSVVIPARNEARNLEIILPMLPAVHEVILVDGNSVDDTIATAQRLITLEAAPRRARRLICSHAGS